MNPRARISMYVGGKKKKGRILSVGGRVRATPLPIEVKSRACACYARTYVCIKRLRGWFGATPGYGDG